MLSVAIKALLPVLERNLRRHGHRILVPAHLHLNFAVLLKVARDKLEPSRLLHPVLFLGEGGAKQGHLICL